MSKLNKIKSQLQDRKLAKHVQGPESETERKDEVLSPASHM